SALLAAIALCASSAVVHAAGDAGFSKERTVVPGRSGPNRLALDVPILAGAQPLRYESGSGAGLQFLGGLADLRMFDASGREVGYLLIAPPAPAERWQDGRLLPIQATKEESGFEVDLRRRVRIDRIRIAGL